MHHNIDVTAPPIHVRYDAMYAAVGTIRWVWWIVVLPLDARTLEVHRVVNRTVTQTTARDAAVGDGKSRAEVVPVLETHVMRINTSTISARWLDGRRVSPRALAEVLAKPSAVILMDGGSKIDALFSTMFKADVLILQLSPQQTPTSRLLQRQ